MLWPGHPKPQEDELLWSWVVRLARANGVPALTFWRILSSDKGHPLSIVHTHTIEPLLSVLSQGTGIPVETIRMTLPSAEPDVDLARTSNHRRSHTRELQYCAVCFTQDKEPYYRRAWQESNNLLCATHLSWLLNKCPTCSIALKLEDLSPQVPNLATCAVCRQNLSRQEVPPALLMERQRFRQVQDRLLMLRTKALKLRQAQQQPAEPSQQPL